MLSNSRKGLPKILRIRTLFETQRFVFEAVKLRFSNKAERVFERIRSKNKRSVLIMPLIGKEHILLVREYSMGVERYTLSFPKGVVECAEPVEEAANRELQEEVGYGAHTIESIKEIFISPGYFSAPCHIVLAQDLYPASLEGDEPEAILVEKWSLHQVEDLLEHPDFIEARSMAALLWLERAWRLNKLPALPAVPVT